MRKRDLDRISKQVKKGEYIRVGVGIYVTRNGRGDVEYQARINLKPGLWSDRFATYKGATDGRKAEIKRIKVYGIKRRSLAADSIGSLCDELKAGKTNHANSSDYVRYFDDIKTFFGENKKISTITKDGIRMYKADLISRKRKGPERRDDFQEVLMSLPGNQIFSAAMVADWGVDESLVKPEDRAAVRRAAVSFSNHHRFDKRGDGRISKKRAGWYGRRWTSAAVKADPLSNRSVDHYLVRLEELLREAVRRDFIKSYPKVQLLGGYGHRDCSLGLDDIKRLTAHLPSETHKLILWMLALTGGRGSDILNLRKTNIKDLPDGEKMLEYTISKATKLNQKQITRRVPLPSKIVKRLEGLDNQTIWLFPNPNTRKPFLVKSFSNVMKTACRKCGMEDHTAHYVRHMVSNVVEAETGSTDATVDYMGWSSPKMLGTYRSSKKNDHIASQISKRVSEAM